MLEFRILGPLEVLDGDVRCRSAAGISARCWRSCSCARTRRSRRSGSSTSSGASTRRGRRRRRCRTPSRSCASCSGRAPAHSADRLRARARRAASSIWPLRAARRGRRATRRAGGTGAACCARRSRSGAAPPLADSSSRRSRRRRSTGSRTFASGCSRSGSLPTSSPARTRELVAEIEALVRAHPLRERLRCS